MASSPPSAVKTKFLIISDTHAGRPTADYSASGAFRKPLPKADVLLHSGDLSMTGALDEYEASLNFLETVDAELKLVIAGNHDISLDEDYYLNDVNAKRWVKFGRPEGEWRPDVPQRARELWTGQRAKAAGVTYLTEGIHSFALNNGAKFTIYASPWQPEFCGWAFNYERYEDRWNPAHLVNGYMHSGHKVVPAPPQRDPHPIPSDITVDIVMTHGPAYGHLDSTKHGDFAGCPHLLNALARVRPLLHCCGHIHEGWGLQRVTWHGKGGGSMGEASETLAGLLGPGMVHADDEEVIEKRAASFDFSGGSLPLEPGRETIFVNSSVVDLGYAPVQAAFVVELDLQTQ